MSAEIIDGKAFAANAQQQNRSRIRGVFSRFFHGNAKQMATHSGREIQGAKNNKLLFVWPP